MEKREQINSGNLEIFSEKIFKFLNGRRFAIVESEREQALVSPKTNPSQRLTKGPNSNKAVRFQYSDKDDLYADLIIATSIRIFDFPILKKGHGENPLLSFNEKYCTIYFRDSHGKEAFLSFSPESKLKPNSFYSDEYEIILSALSEKHFEKTKDPIRLYTDNFRNFNFDCSLALIETQKRFLSLAKRNKLSWSANYDL